MYWYCVAETAAFSTRRVTSSVLVLCDAQDEAATAKAILRVVDKAESEYQVCLNRYSLYCMLLSHCTTVCSHFFCFPTFFLSIWIGYYDFDRG